MLLELDKHFEFWSDKIFSIHDEAVKSLKILEGEQGKDRLFFNELQHNIHPLMPKSQKPVIENKEIELQLLNMQMYAICSFRLKDAVFVRRKNLELKERMIKETHTKRKMQMGKEKHFLQEDQHDKKRNLLFMIQESLNKVIARRRKEFEK